MALNRIFYICDELPRSNEFLPNIKHVKDIIPNNICYVRNPIDPLRIDSESDEASIKSLIELLRSPDIQPTIRKSTLLQLNVMASNPRMNQVMYDLDAWIDIVILLENALIEKSRYNIDEIIPAVGIISKFALQHPLFRSDILEETFFIFTHLIRALLLFHSNVNLKQDANVALFLFLFHDYVLGSTQIKVPLIVSKLKIPILTEFYARSSENYTKSDIEKLFLSKYAEPIESQFFRQQFTFLWFGSFDEVLKNVSKCIDNETIKSKMDYRLLPGNHERSKILKFNPDIYIIRPDIYLINATSPRELFIQHLDKIMKANNLLDVSNAIHSISSLLELTFDKNNIEFYDLINTALSQYYTIPPNTTTDIKLFINILNLLSKLINYGFDNFTYPLLSEFKRRKSAFDIILNDNSTPCYLFSATVSFIILVLKEGFSSLNKDVINILKTKNEENGLLEELFESISNSIIKMSKADDFGKSQFNYL